ncbi:MAG: MFS transporter [Bacteroidetes bacterium]|nr:MFS transporter [Bacteroidota bacterium]
MNRDILLLFAARMVRMFAYGFLSVILALYLVEIGLSEAELGLLLTLTLAGDAVITFWLTTRADRVGRRRMLIVGAALMVFAGSAFLLTQNYVLLIFSAIIGVISPSGNEIGPFLSIEQAALSQLIRGSERTSLFGRYHMSGSVATAGGSLVAGFSSQYLQNVGWSALESYRVVLIGYVACGLVLWILFIVLSTNIESPQTQLGPATMGLHRSKKIVFKLSALFALDAFGGGFVIQSIVAYWFYVKFGVSEATLGVLFFGTNVLAAISALLAAKIADRIGLINTMVFTHIPSNVLLGIIPLMPNVPMAMGVLLARSAISQMDVPTRQSFTMAVVSPDERSAAAGVSAIARSVGAAASPVMSGWLLASPLFMSFPFFVAAGLKIIYDVILFRSFNHIKPPDETLS